MEQKSPQRAVPKIIDGKKIAEEIHNDVEKQARELKLQGLEPHLVAVQAGGDPATGIYIEKQREKFAKLGIRYSHIHEPGDATLDRLLATLRDLGARPDVTGIMLMQPLPPHIPSSRLEEAIAPEKDVEGVHPLNAGLLVHGRHLVAPCTALGAFKAIESTGVPIAGKRAVIVGRSNIVGKPVGLLLLQARATVTTCHTATRDFAQEIRRAEILVVAAGKPGLITGDMVSDGTVVIDVGIHRIEGPPARTVGDVEFESVAPKASWITPVPGGVGPITVAMLARNTITCVGATALRRL